MLACNKFAVIFEPSKRTKGKNMTIKINKSSNVGNTFYGLVATAFPGAWQISVDLNAVGRNCGTAYVDGVAYDWVDHGEYVNFMRAQ